MDSPSTILYTPRIWRKSHNVRKGEELTFKDDGDGELNERTKKRGGTYDQPGDHENRSSV